MKTSDKLLTKTLIGSVVCAHRVDQTEPKHNIIIIIVIIIIINDDDDDDNNN